MPEPPLPRRWPYWLAGAATLIWLGLALVVAASALARAGILPAAAATPPELALVAATLVALLPPIALLWLVADRLRDGTAARTAYAQALAATGAEAEATVLRAREALAALDSGLGAATGRVAQISDRLDQHRTQLSAAGDSMERSAGTLTTASDAVRAAGQQLTDATPKAMAQAEELATLICHIDDDLKRQLDQTETLLAALHVTAGEAEEQAATAVQRASAGIDAVASAGERAATSTSEVLGNVIRAADTAASQTAAAIAASNEAVGSQTRMLMESVTHVRAELDDIGGEAARQVSRRLDLLTEAANRLGEQLIAQEQRSRAMVEQVERAFAILDAKLANSVSTGAASLDDLAQRMAAARDAIHVMGEPLAATGGALRDVEERMAAVGEQADRTLGLIGTEMPRHLPQLDVLNDRLTHLHGRVAALAAPIEAGGETIDSAADRFSEQREALDRTITALIEALSNGRETPADIETAAGTSALAATQQLIDVLGQVREVAGQTAGTMRETLAGIVAEAEQALEKAGREKAETAFATPIRASLAGVEQAADHAAATAQAASERIVARLVNLTETVATVEKRIDEVDTAYDVKLRDDLGRRAETLVQSLNSTAVDIAQLLRLDIGDAVWTDYLKGDKGAFARAGARLLDAGTERTIARHFDHDPPFREQAVRYIDDFEALIARVLPDREGKALALALLSSDNGRLYAILTQATRRFDPPA